MKFSLVGALVACCAIGAHAAHIGNSNKLANRFAPPLPPNATDIDHEVRGHGFFQQTLDHSDPSSGTFQQFYYWGDKWYKGPGSPIIIFTPGEINATGYEIFITRRSIYGQMAEAIGAAVIILEHRYWGQSSPYDDLSTENMQYLTLDNAIADLVNFAKTAVLPFDPKGLSRPNKAPWILVGGSYSGALTAWTAAESPGTFHAYFATSAPVEAVGNYWSYFYPVQEGMPQNCSTDVTLVIDHVDQILTSGTSAEVTELKTMFGLETVSHNADFASALQNGPWLWQGNQFWYNEGFYGFCDGVEGVTSKSTTLPGPNGVGLQKALKGYAKWFNGTFLPGYCESFGYSEYAGTYNTKCFDTYDPSNPVFSDHTLSNTFDRQWTWMLCNEPFGYWQNGAPTNRPTIVSRLVNNDYWTRQCGLYFPPGPNGETYGLNKGATYNGVNARTQGWDFTNTTNLMWINGQHDPWRESGVSSDFRPGGPLQSTANAPVMVIPLGFHCSDIDTPNGIENAGVLAVQQAEIKQLKTWVSEFKPS